MSCLHPVFVCQGNGSIQTSLMTDNIAKNYFKAWQLSFKNVFKKSSNQLCKLVTKRQIALRNAKECDRTRIPQKSGPDIFSFRTVIPHVHVVK